MGVPVPNFFFLRALIALVIAVSFSSECNEASEGASGRVTELAPLVTTGRDAGPHVWEFVRGETRVLVLGTIQPARRHMDYIQASIRDAIGRSDVVLGSPGVVIGDGIGVFRALTLWPAIRKLKYLPAGLSLRDVVSAEDYERWSELKAEYLESDEKVERMRPMYAAWQLYEGVMRTHRMDSDNQLVTVVRELAKQSGIEVLDTRYRMGIADPRSTVRNFTVPRQEDLNCFRNILRDVETVPMSVSGLADAWAEGDVAEMSDVLSEHPLPGTCWGPLTNEAVARQQGVSLDQRIQDVWLSLFRKVAVGRNIIFITAPVEDLLGQSGRVRWLLDEGFSGAASSSLPGKQD